MKTKLTKSELLAERDDIVKTLADENHNPKYPLAKSYARMHKMLLDYMDAYSDLKKRAAAMPNEKS